MSRSLEDIASLPRLPVASASSSKSANLAKIDLPFNLYLSRGERRTLSNDEWKTLGNLFPTTYAVAFTVLGLVIRVRQLPPRPHPVMVADAPLYLTTDEDDATGWNNWGTLPPGAGGRALQHLNFKDLASLDVATCDEIAHFCVEHKIPLHSIRLLFSPSLVCILQRPHPAKELPTTFGGLICLWKVIEPGITPLAARGREPSINQPENTNYAPDLRPGVIFSSLVEKSKYPASAGTDTALAELAPGIHHTNEVFVYQESSLRLGDPVTEVLKLPQLIEFDSPFDGLSSGVMLSDEMLLIIPDVDESLEVGTERRWIKGYWISSSGKDGGDPTEGTYGNRAVLLQDTGAVAGFFRYHNYANHISYIEAASNIANRIGGRGG